MLGLVVLFLCVVLGSYQRLARHPYHCKELNKIIGGARGGEAEVADMEGSALSSSTPMGGLTLYHCIWCWLVHRDWRDGAGSRCFSCSA